jgi:hypothetical protein
MATLPDFLAPTRPQHQRNLGQKAQEGWFVPELEARVKQ